MLVLNCPTDMGDFMVTHNYYQVLFDGSIIFTHLAMVRMYIYLLISDFRKSFAKFQWLKFLRIEDEQTLIKKHYFTLKEASSYLRLVRLFIKFIKLNELVYVAGCIGVQGRLVYLSYNHIPFHWIILSTIPNLLLFLFMTRKAFALYYYYVLIFFSQTLFIQKSLRSLRDRRSVRLPDNKSKLRLLCERNLTQFNYVINNFRQSQRNLNYTFSYSLGLVLIAFNFPYLALFTDMDILSFLVTVSLYIQCMATTIWLLILSNRFVIQAVSLAHQFSAFLIKDRTALKFANPNIKNFHPIAFQVKDYSNFLHLLIYDCPSIRLKLKLANFFAIHQAENRISYKYILQMWDLTNEWFLFFLLESVSIVILIYSFNFL